jgi:hypothetical protein
MGSELISFPLFRNGIIEVPDSRKGFIKRISRMTYSWHESYKAAIFETDWNKMEERLQAAEREIHERQRVLSLDHDGTPEERQAIADALFGLSHLRTEAGDWQKRQFPETTALNRS